MKTDLRTSLNSFRRNLRWQLEDAELGDRGIKVELYFDAADVRRTVLGMHSLIINDHVDVAAFSSKITLVHCLASSGRLGRINMLVPHQAEFLKLLRLGLAVASPGKEPNPDEFLKAVGINSIAKPFAKLSAKDLRQFVEENASRAIDLFKVNECIALTWEDRLAKLRSEVLEINSQEVDFPEIVKSDEFDRVKHAFEYKRPGKDENNLADTVAVCILLSMMKACDEGTAEAQPRFFVSTELFKQALLKADLYVDRIFRGHDYFVLKAICEGKGLSVAELYELDSQLENIVSGHPDQIQINPPVIKLIEQLNELSFFQNVWLPYSAHTDISRTIKSLRVAEKWSKSEKLNNAVKEALESTKSELARSAQKYREVSELWSAISQASKALKGRIVKESVYKLDVFRDLGLLRFGFPEKAGNSIRDSIEALIKDGEQAERNACERVLEALNIPHDEKPSSKENEIIATGFAILWVIKMHQKIVEVFRRFQPSLHYSVKTVYAAAVFKGYGKLSQASEVISQLKSDYEKAKGSEERASLGICLAYLLFHQWLSLGHSSIWRQSSNLRDAKEKKIVDMAIDYAAKAFVELRQSSKNIKKTIYALNQLLYYMVEGSDNSKRSQMDQLAEQLLRYKPNSDLWQYRFDDTLARYFHRIATSASSVERWLELMARAKQHIHFALSESHGDEEVSSYASIIYIDLEKGYPSPLEIVNGQNLKCPECRSGSLQPIRGQESAANLVFTCTNMVHKRMFRLYWPSIDEPRIFYRLVPGGSQEDRSVKYIVPNDWKFGSDG